MERCKSASGGRLQLSADRRNMRRTTIRLTLENTSTLPVDFVKLTFQDTHTISAASYVAENELSAGEAFEIESYVRDNPVFRWSGSTAHSIPPGGSSVLEVECLGKVGW